MGLIISRGYMFDYVGPPAWLIQPVPLYFPMIIPTESLLQLMIVTRSVLYQLIGDIERIGREKDFQPLDQACTSVCAHVSS